MSVKRLVCFAIVFFFGNWFSANVVWGGEILLTKSERVGMSGERLDRIATVMRKLIDEKKIPGTVSLVARRGKVVHFEANGLRDAQRGLPMELDTIFRLYSQTKPIVGAAVMVLFEEGHFLLSDPISKYLPEFSNMRVYLGEQNDEIRTEPASPITIHHLLTHTSGLTYEFFPNPVGKMYLANGVSGSAQQFSSAEEGMVVGSRVALKNLEEWSRLLAKMPLLAQPGNQWNYGMGMEVLGRLIEVVSGKSLGAFLEERIFSPLGMVDTGFYVPTEKVGRFAANYVSSPGGRIELFDDPRTSPYLVPPALEMGGGGLVATVGDYFRFAQMLANKGEYNGTRILGRKTVEFMVSNHLPPHFPDDALSSVKRPMGQGRAWGMGFGISGSVITNPATHGLPVSKGLYAWGGAASTNFWVDHKEELVGIIHTQLFGRQPTEELMQVTTYQAIVD